jgi:oligopeptidase B
MTHPTRPQDRIVPKTPPRAEKRPHAYRVHGVDMIDDYAWLKAANWQEVLRNPAVLPADIRALLDAENEYAKAILAPGEELRAHLFAELRARIKEDDVDVPAPDGPFVYYRRHRTGGQHPLFCRRSRDTAGDETIMLDGDELGKDKSFFQFGGMRPSPDHRLVAWSADDKGSELFTLRLRDLKTGQDLDDEVPDTSGSMVWSADGSAILYVKLDDNHRPHCVMLHRLGTQANEDVCLYLEEDPGWFVGIHATQSRRFCIVDLHDHNSSEVRLIDLADVSAAPRLVAARKSGLRYEIEHHEQKLIILTNADGAEDFKLVTADLETPGLWQDFVGHRRGRMIMSHLALRHHLVRLERENGLPQIVIRDMADGTEHAIAFAEEAYSLGLDTMREFDTKTLRFSYSSMTTPREIFDYDMTTRERILRKRQDIPSGHDPAQYVTRRIFAPAHDGEIVPVSLLYRRDLVLDGSAPLLLQGYGAYGHASPASFSAHRFSLVDRGFVYAIAHIRGGTDKGWHWYENGKLANKPNTFADFISAARHLCAEKYTREGRIVGLGGSAGGMLMGAVANMAPELFAGIIADVPFVDVLNTMLDAELPLTPPEWVEWGNPGKDLWAFETIRSYSPYDNVRAQKYPAMLVQAGLTDPRVTYWEPAKWVARLRERMNGGGPVILHTNMEAGHGGAAGRFEALKDVAREYAFAIDCVEGTHAG